MTPVVWWQPVLGVLGGLLLIWFALLAVLWQAQRMGTIRQVIERRLAQPSRRDVGDPQEGDVILGIYQEAQVGQDVLDLQPLVERDAADDLIGDLRGPEGRLEAARQGRHPAEDRDVAEGVSPLVDQLDDLRGDRAGLVGLGRVDGQLHRRAVGVLGGQ